MSARWEPSHHAQPNYLAYLSKLNSAELKRVARHWAGTKAYKLDKTACEAAIRGALDDPARIRAVVALLSEFERAVLGVLKAHGGSAPPGDLAAEVAALGLKPPPSHRGFWHGGEGAFDLLNPLLEKGLILAASPGSTWDRPSLRLHWSYQPPALVFSDPRLFAAVDGVPPRPLAVAPLAAAELSWARRPGEALADLLSVLEAIRRLGDIPTTGLGHPSTSAIKRLKKILGWGDDEEATGEAPGVRHPVPFYVSTLRELGHVVFDPRTRRLSVDPEAGSRLEHPCQPQARAWLNAYPQLPARFEARDATIYWADPSPNGKLAATRRMLIRGLASLPDPPNAWFEVQAFSDALFERAGEYVSLEYLPPFSAYHYTGPAEAQKKRAEWRAGLRERWRRVETPWIAEALRGPLYELGLVELGLIPGHRTGSPSCFRLTDLGRMALSYARGGEEASPEVLQSPGSSAPCLVVQPNFDVVVYLDRAPPPILGLLERAGERVPARGATATYRLTRGSVCAALEAGVGIEALLNTLAEAAGHGLPANVETTLREWADRRERLIVRRAVRVLEFPDAVTRDAAAISHHRGTPLGERYFLLDSSVSRRAVLAAAGPSIDYEAPPARCLDVSENGTVTLDPSRVDLLIRAQVARWTDPEEREGGGRWRITRGSVERATRAGTSAEEILTALSARAIHVLPPLLAVAIRAWGGARNTVALASATILRVFDPETFRAIATSPLPRKHLEGVLGADALVVKPGAAEAVHQILGDLGLVSGTELFPGGLPPQFKPRPLPAGDMTDRPSVLAPIARKASTCIPLDFDSDGGENTGESLGSDWGNGRLAAKIPSGIALTPGETLELIEEAVSAQVEVGDLLMAISGAMDAPTRSRRGRRRSRRRSQGQGLLRSP